MPYKKIEIIYNSISSLCTFKAFSIIHRSHRPFHWSPRPFFTLVEVRIITLQESTYGIRR